MRTFEEMKVVFHSDMSVALVTGINGFTGKHILPELKRAGFEVVGIAQEISNSPGAKTFSCDLNNCQQTINVVGRICPDVVFHLAGVAFAAHDDVDLLYRSNIVGTRNLLVALSKCPKLPRAVLLASSANVYGNAAVSPITEETPPNPANDYAVSKLAMEHMAQLWKVRLPITIVRPFNYSGQGQSLQFLLPKIVDHFKRRASLIKLGNLNVVRDFSDVRTVVSCYRLLAEATATDGVYNVCSGRGYSLQKILAIMRKISGHDLEVVVNPELVRENEISQLIGSRARLENTIGSVTQVPIEKTLAGMLQE